MAASKACRYCFACVRSVPVVFISALIAWSYYAYVVKLCFRSDVSIIEKLLYLVIFHPLLVMMLWSYYKSIFTPVSTPPKQFYLGLFDLERLSQETSQVNRREILAQIGRPLPIQCRTLTGEIRYCDRCTSIRPDRAHHCSVCGQCILKMDHHCPWVNNCVNFSNYKFFILFLSYALSYSLFVAFSSLQYFILFWKGGSEERSNLSNLHIVFLFFAGIMFSISLVTLLGYHIFLICKNRSTLEAFQVPCFVSTGPDRNAYDLGVYRNFVEVFGTRRIYWFLPIFTGAGDGVRFPTKADDEQRASLLGQRQRWAEQGESDDNHDEGEEGQFLPRS